MSSVQDDDYTHEYADDVILRPENNFLWRMIFFERLPQIDENGKVSTKTKKRVKFEIRVPFDAISDLYHVMDTMRKKGKEFRTPLRQFNKLTKDEQKAYADIARTFWSKDYDFEKPDNPYLTRSKMHFLNIGLDREYNEE